MLQQCKKKKKGPVDLLAGAEEVLATDYLQFLSFYQKCLLI